MICASRHCEAEAVGRGNPTRSLALLGMTLLVRLLRPPTLRRGPRNDIVRIILLI